ncbi:MAG TPA: Ca2+-dependent phosphoinositide-specific phospholipase C, partial [Terrimesophilobacter sp.]|nr:Ca2+-dependent phosphoinositide-specific phospholipase C [Terrimesophilobacter sp.]
MNTAKRVLIVALVSVGGLVLVAVAAVAAVYITGSVIASDSATVQHDRLASVRADVAAQPGGVFEGWRENPIEDRVSWDRVQSIATHNSYAVAPNGIQNLVLDLVRPGESAALAYSHDPLWHQLEQGVRSLEFDLRVHSDGALRMTHVPVLANGSHSPDFRLALEELELWSSSHPGHLPLTVLIEFKSDYSFLDPSLAEWSVENLALVDEAVADAFGERLLTPAEIGVEPWPFVRELRDRVMVIMHPNESVESAYASVPAAGRTMFAAADGGNAAVPIAEGGPRFVVHNDPDAATIRQLVDAGLIVRTRADADLVTSPVALTAALASGAQLVSTDFASPTRQAGTGYSARFDDGTLARIDPERAPTAGELRHVDALDWVDAATTRELAGSVLMATIIGTNTDQLRSLMVESGLGGFILMGGNVPGSESALRDVTAALTVDPELPPLIAIDEEGGVVKRIPWDPYPGA